MNNKISNKELKIEEKLCTNLYYIKNKSLINNYNKNNSNISNKIYNKKF